jgi:hypothetical protein
MHPTDAILAVIPDHHIPSQAIIKNLKPCTSPLSQKYSEPSPLQGVVYLQTGSSVLYTNQTVHGNS